MLILNSLILLMSDDSGGNNRTWEDGIPLIKTEIVQF